LRAKDFALCVADTGEDTDAPFTATASWGYLRLRREAYDDEAMATWRERVRAQSWKEAFVFFKHEQAGAAAKMAARFMEG
jgi:uncharacterized protein YecE (DUF72 family)